MLSRPAYIAHNLIKELFIEDPNEVDLEAIINFHGAYYQEKSMSGAEGRIIFHGNQAIVTINSEIRYAPKKRFVIAHELGHLLLHKNLVPLFNCNEAAFMEWYNTSSYEAQANEFASEVLMPQHLFEREARKLKKIDFGVVKQLAQFFQTSITSTVIRFISVGTHPAAVVYSVKGKVNWQQFGSEFIFKRFKTRKGSPVPNQTVAADIHAGKATFLKKELVLATSWFYVFDSQADIYLYEECFSIPSQNGILSLIWVCEDL